MLAVKETCIIHFFALGIAAIAFILARPRKPGAAALKAVLAAAVVFLLTAVLMFTWFGQNWRGLADLFRAVPSFAARAGGEGHEKPFWYYAQLLGGGWSGAALTGLTAAGLGFVIFDFTRQKIFRARAFISIYAIVIVVVYGAIPYKTPWLALNFWLPMALLAGGAVARILEKTGPSAARWLWLLPAILIAGATGHDLQKRVFQFPAAEDNPYAYAHTGEDMLRLPARLEQLAKERNLTQPLIAVVAADAWPLPWYLRKFPRAGFWQPGQNPGAADFFITSPEAAERLGDRLDNCRQEFFGVRPDVLMILWVPAAKEVSP
jgi:predicted membrane-bound mannosyltransferase